MQTVLATTAAVCLSATAVSANLCNPHEIVSTYIADEYGEAKRFMALDFNGRLVELYASEESGNWTLTVTDPNMMACIVAAGVSFETLPVIVGDEG